MNNKTIKSHYTTKAVIRKYLFTYLKVKNLKEINIIKIKDILQYDENESFLVKNNKKDINTFLTTNQNFYYKIEGDIVESYEQEWSIVETKFIGTLNYLEKEIKNILNGTQLNIEIFEDIVQLLESQKENIFNYIELDILRSNYNRGSTLLYDLATDEEIKGMDLSASFANVYMLRGFEKTKLEVDDLKIHEEYDIYIINTIPAAIFTPSSFILGKEGKIIFVTAINLGIFILLKKNLLFYFDLDKNIQIIEKDYFVKNSDKFCLIKMAPYFTFVIDKSIFDAFMKNSKVEAENIKERIHELFFLQWILNFGAKGYPIYLLGNENLEAIEINVNRYKEIIEDERKKHLDDNKIFAFTSKKK